MAKKQPHEWVRGRKGLFGGTYLYFKRCKNCGVQLQCPKKEWDSLAIVEQPA